MKLSLKLIATFFVALMMSFNVFAAKITITMGGDDERAMREHYRFALDWAEENGHEIGYVYRPASATDTLNLYQQICSSGSSDIDIFMIDVIWPGIFADCAYDLNNIFDDAHKADFFEGIVVITLLVVNMLLFLISRMQVFYTTEQTYLINMAKARLQHGVN